MLNCELMDIKTNELIRLSKSVLDDKEKNAVIEVLNKGYLGMGKEVQKFEKSLSTLMNRRVVCVVNGTAALHLALQACGIGQGDEVLVQSITYLASFQAISAAGAKPIPCDIDLNTLTIDIEDAKKRITKNTKAIMPVHYAGDLGNYESIYKFAETHNLRVIEDAAHAFGTKKGDSIVGSFGDIVCFSFDGIKNITCGEGGCITSSDNELLNKIEDLRLLGIANDTSKRYKGERSWEYNVTDQGWRYHMSDIMASIGLSQLKKLDIFSKKRQLLSLHYDQRLKNVMDINVFKRDYSKVVPHIYPVRLSKKINREKLQEYLKEKNIQTGIHYKPNHLLSLYYDLNSLPLKNTEEIYQNILSLPLHPELETKHVDFIVDCINQFFE